ncbi:4'-phosphopantetheinyl transferase family protein [Metabacillus halosaccharovorans]|uniref:4'-phosphopantetheinyl transferase family protein n=1 Tax=Metabacillus halosaccharovorans TaxID=930124 RepID=UPI001C1FBD59|nr:4'-phosphopantetheinyl transferase superfamily protein [Metabacillus halosaccharovorans]MBU7595713.1 4'-phosphopantetheinyl transferase superfamily protein [Metabacillus halosaccharovorans]
MEIYAVNIENLNELNFDYRTYNQILSEQTLDKANSFRHYKDSIRTIIGELLIHYLYIQRQKTSYSTLVILRNEYGKPYCNNKMFHFNVSHAGNWVVCVVDTQQVGIDIELIRDIDYTDIISLFHPSESQKLKKTTTNMEHFFKLWTVKESVIKNLGKGLSIPFNTFFVFLDHEVTSVHFEGDKLINGTEYHVKMYDFKQNYQLAVCALHNNFPEVINYIEPSKFSPYLLEKYIM